MRRFKNGMRKIPRSWSCEKSGALMSVRLVINESLWTIGWSRGISEAERVRLCLECHKKVCHNLQVDCTLSMRVWVIKSERKGWVKDGSIDWEGRVYGMEWRKGRTAQNWFQHFRFIFPKLVPRWPRKIMGTYRKRSERSRKFQMMKRESILKASICRAECFGGLVFHNGPRPSRTANSSGNPFRPLFCIPRKTPPLLPYLPQSIGLFVSPFSAPHLSWWGLKECIRKSSLSSIV